MLCLLKARALDCYQFVVFLHTSHSYCVIYGNFHLAIFISMNTVVLLHRYPKLQRGTRRFVYKRFVWQTYLFTKRIKRSSHSTYRRDIVSLSSCVALVGFSKFLSSLYNISKGRKHGCRPSHEITHSNGRKSSEIKRSAKFLLKSFSAKPFRYVTLVSLPLLLCFCTQTLFLWSQTPPRRCSRPSAFKRMTKNTTNPGGSRLFSTEHSRSSPPHTGENYLYTRVLLCEVRPVLKYEQKRASR